MTLRIMPNYWMVRINKEEQLNFKTKVSKKSLLYMPLGSVHESRNMEHCEIVQVGEGVKNILESAVTGNTLILHWSITANQDKTGKCYFLYEDDIYNYYAVDEINVRGCFDGEKIECHPNYIFLKNIPVEVKEEISQTTSGLFLYNNWDDSETSKQNKIKNIQNRIDGLLKSKRINEVQTELEKLEKEKQQINAAHKKKKYMPYMVAYSNKIIDRDFGKKIAANDIVYCFNQACLYISNFQDKDYTYIICPVEYIGGLVA